MNGESHGGLCERRGERDLLAVGPHPSLAELAYHRASRAAHRAWANSQPQYVIPGVLDETDAGTQTSLGVCLVEPAGPPETSPPGGLTDSGTDPRFVPGLTANQSDAPGHPGSSHSGVVVGAATSTTTRGAANPQPEKRGAPQIGV